MQHIVRTTAFCFFMLTAAAGANAQVPDEPRTAMRELYRLHSVFAEDQTLAFDCVYYLEDADIVVVRDTLTGFFKFYYDQYWIKIDSVEQVQDNLLSVTAYHENETMMVRNPSPFSTYVFQSNVLDSLFLNYTDSVTLSDSAAYRKIKFHFKSWMPYTNYEIVYDTANYHMQTVNCSMRKSIPTPSEAEMPLDNKHIHLKIVFSNYRIDSDDPSIYSTDRFIERKNGGYVPKSPYTNYQLVNSINQ